MKLNRICLLQLIFCSLSAYSNLSVVTWGDGDSGGDLSSVATQLSSNVTKIYTTDDSFAALKDDGSVVSWGKFGSSVNYSSVASQLSSGVTEILTSYNAFAALKDDGSVVTWGEEWWGGDSSTHIVSYDGIVISPPISVASQLSSGVTKIYSNDSAFAALKDDGSVVTWGDGDSGGDSKSVTSPYDVTINGKIYGAVTNVASQLSSDVIEIYPCNGSFAALKNDGSVVAWGDSSASNSAGNTSSVASSLTGIKSIFATNQAFAALTSNNQVVAWGDQSAGGALPSGGVSNVDALYSNYNAFVALKTDGNLVAWGSGASGTTPSPNLGNPTSSLFMVRFAHGAINSIQINSTEGHGRYLSGAIDRRYTLPTYPSEFNVSQVTAIPSFTAVNTPSYVFKSNRTGIITSNLGFSTSNITSATNNTTITFNTLANGTYTGKTVTVTYADHIPAQTLTIPDFVINNNPPTLSQVTAITTPSQLQNPSYVFSSNQPGIISSNLSHP